MTFYGFNTQRAQLARMQESKNLTKKIKKVKGENEFNKILGLSDQEGEVFWWVLKNMSTPLFLYNQFVVKMLRVAYKHFLHDSQSEKTAEFIKHRKAGDFGKMMATIGYIEPVRLSLTEMRAEPCPDGFALLCSFFQGVKTPVILERMRLAMEQRDKADKHNQRFYAQLTPKSTMFGRLVGWACSEELAQLPFELYKKCHARIATSYFGFNTINHIKLMTSAGIDVCNVFGSAYGYYTHISNDGQPKNPLKSFFDSTKSDSFLKMCTLIAGCGNDVLKSSFGHFANQITIQEAQQVFDACDFRYFDVDLANSHPVGFYEALVKMGSTPDKLLGALKPKEIWEYLQFFKEEKIDINYILHSALKFLYLGKKLVKVPAFLNLTLGEKYKTCWEIARYTSDRNMFFWATHHLEQLTRKITYNANGHVYTTNSYHILGSIHAQDLTQGLRTSFYKLKELYRRRQYTYKLPEVNTPLPKFPLDIKDCRIVQIDTSEGLLQESIKMSHCVATYFQRCMEEKSYIFHVDDGSKNGVTVEIKLSYGKEFKIAQIQSYLDNDIEKATTIMEDALREINTKVFGVSDQGKVKTEVLGVDGIIHVL